MVCPHCQSPRLRNLNRRTELGYAVFRCGGCRRKCNERTGTPFNYLELPTDIVFEIVLCRLRYKLSLRNLAEIFLLRGFEFTHEAVREWEERFAPLLAEHIRRKRKGKMGRRWYVDETYIKVKGKWCYLYRAIDREGNLVEFDAQRDTGHGCSPAVLSQRSVHGERTANKGHHGRSRFLSTGDPGSARPEGGASL
jgi:putative transposase